MKHFFEQYGGVALGILALLVLIAMITPVGNIVKTSLQGTVHKFSTSINSQVDDDIQAMGNLQSEIIDSIVYAGNITNYNGQDSFPDTYTEADVIWPANYDFGDSITLYAEIKGWSPTESYLSNHELAGAAIQGKASGMCFIFYIDDYIHLCTSDFNPEEVNKFAGIYDGNTAKLYVNGVVKAVAEQTGNIKPSKMPMIVGNPEEIPVENSRVSPPTSDIYRVAVYDGALTPEQIENLQNK